MVIVGPGAQNPTHHVSLSDGAKTVGLVICNVKGESNPNAITRTPVPRTALKTTTGNQTYNDFEPPWSPVAQEDWSGGRGQAEFEKDTTRFADSLRAQTMFTNKAFLGPQETYSTGYRNQDIHLPGNVSWNALIPGARKCMAVKYVAGASYNVEHIYILVRRVGNPEHNITVEMCANLGDEPNTVLQTATITPTEITDVVSVLHRTTITAQAQVAGTNYWIKVYSDGDNDNHWEIGVNAASGTSKQSPNGTDWTTSSIDVYFRLTDADASYSPIFIKYLYARYMILNTEAAAPKLYISGDRGVADVNTGALLTLIDATKTWTTDAWKGCVVYIWKGKGADEWQPWRNITANDASSLTVDSAWKISHDITTEYVILGSNKWAEITGHGLTVPVTDVCMISNYCYLCQGDDVNFREWKVGNNAGLYENYWREDSTAANKAVFMETVRDTTSGIVIWRAQNKDIGSNISVSKAPPVVWGTELAFETPINFKDSWGKITSVQEYDDPKKLWVMREGSVFAASAANADEINLAEIHGVAEYSNGRGSLVHNVYLYFNLGGGLERYYNKTMDDIGPNRDEGMPVDSRGEILSLVGYPGRFFAGIDGGTSNYSSVLGYNGTGWHSIYRAPMKGLRIKSMDFDPIPGDIPDRLWVSVGADILWLAFPSKGLNPLQDANFRYTHEGVITSAWMNCNLFDVWKFYHSVKIFAENLGAGQTVAVDYRVDDNEDWITIDGVFDESPVKEINFNETGVSGKRIQMRMRMLTNDASKTPVIKSLVVENVSRVPVKYSFGFAYRATDNDVNLRSQPDEMGAEARQDTLDEWAAGLTPLVMRSNKRAMDNRVVFIDPATINPYMEASEAYIGKLTVVEI